ncbi:ribonuclease HII [Chiayiivirga flava]|uniref:Ribonuclease HII n=1 Tax=Chiayiivirga flava TaxID=659595 RepID=A0A7W8FZU1_9GAMM|nr:ribonuclease HII [Chiayiivirga flava]MBB5208476.1 ribonuclease HII [Chiayiivirga flava]
MLLAEPGLAAEAAVTPAPRSRAETALIAGVDEAGRGPLAGPVVVAAVILDPKRRVRGINDSKQLTEAEREALYPRIVAAAIAYHIVVVAAAEIDRINIFQATMRGMRDALCNLGHVPGVARIDGNHLPKDLPCPAQAWIGGDARCRSIGAASILAKVTRDRLLVELDALYPAYGFARHKGYSTPEHLAALARHGPCPEHRRSYEPVRRAATPGLF